MKKVFLLACSMSTLAAFAQQKTISQAIITTKTTIVVPEGEDDNNMPPPNPSGDGPTIIRRFGDAGGETKSTTYLKNDLVKTVVNSEMGRTTTIRNNAEKKTTTLMEIMGNKTGFYATDAEMEEGRKKMDSMIQNRTGNGNGSNANRSSEPPVIEVAYAAETKKILGIECKKAYIISTRTTNTIDPTGNLGKKVTVDSSTVWYAPDFKLQGLTNTGGVTGFAMFTRGTALSGLDQLNGFPMMYEMKMRNNRKMVVEVTKIELDKEIKDKEFEISKDFELKNIKDMQSPGGGMRITIRD